jgi:hypothetical protein
MQSVAQNKLVSKPSAVRLDPFDALDAAEDDDFDRELAAGDDGHDPIVNAMRGILARRATSRIARGGVPSSRGFRRPTMRARGRTPRRRRPARRVRRTTSARGSPSSGDGAAAPNVVLVRPHHPPKNPRTPERGAYLAEGDAP